MIETFPILESEVNVNRSSGYSYLKIGLVFHVPRDTVEGLEWPELSAKLKERFETNTCITPGMRILFNHLISYRPKKCVLKIIWACSIDHVDLPVDYVFDVESIGNDFSHCIVDRNKRYQYFGVIVDDKPDEDNIRKLVETAMEELLYGEEK